MAVSKRLRYEVLRRDNFTCRYCGAHPPENELRVDHVVPSALGGTDDPTNLAAACEPCNTGKSASSPDEPLVADVRADALRWAQAMRRAADIAAADRGRRDEHRTFFADAWREWTYEHRGKRHTIPLPEDWPDTIDRLHAAGLTDDDVVDAVESTMRARGVADEFRYFAGVCWRMVADRHDVARALLEGGATDGA